MFITLRQLVDCQEAIMRVGALPIVIEHPEISYRMSKNVTNLTKSADLKRYQREMTKLLMKFGKTKPENPNQYTVSGQDKLAHDALVDKLQAEETEIRIRTIDFKTYVEAIQPGQISPADISALDFIFTFPDDFDDEKPTPKQSAKAVAGKKSVETTGPASEDAEEE